jgi:L-alanine-DL-glutamate epimerase-like enolase superfamily enzyme
VRGVTDLPLQVDVNETWTLDEALESPAPRLGVQYCEQPLPAGDPDGPS